MEAQTTLRDSTARRYKPRVGAMLGIGLVLTYWGAVSALQERSPAAWAALAAGVIMLVRTALRRPTLEVDMHGIRIRGLFSTTSGRWRDVGPLLPATAGYDLAWRRCVEATMVDDAGRKSILSIQDAFSTPLDEILDQIDLLRQGRSHEYGLNIATGPDISEPRARPWTWVTFALTAVLCTVYAAEWTVRDGDNVNDATLRAMGSVSWSLVRGGDWYRMLTAPLLHLNTVHFASNLVLLWVAGRCLERRVGAAWMFTTYAVGALAASAMSMATLQSRVMSVGASGPIMALLAALVVTGFGLPRGRGRINVQVLASGMLAASLLPLNHFTSVDYGAHLGGAVAGSLIGLLLLATWHEAEDAPSMVREATVAAWTGASLMTASVVIAGMHFASGATGQTTAEGLIPDNALPKSEAAWIERAPALEARYPRDPRPWAHDAIGYLQRGDQPSAKTALQRAILLADVPDSRRWPSLANTASGILALILESEGRYVEAPVLAARACIASGTRSIPPPVAEALRHLMLCPGGARG